MQVLLETGAISNANTKNLRFKPEQQQQNTLIEFRVNRSVKKDIYIFMIFFFFSIFTTWYS